VLIVDYILDWARDVYRPSILRHLKSITTGKAYDEISLAADSDVFSMRRHISSWIPAPPSTIDESELEENLGPSNALSIPMPNTKLGTVRSAAISEFRFVSLHITQNNVTSLLQLAAGNTQNTEHSTKAARELVNFITRWDEMLLLTGADLDELEYLWTENMRADASGMDSSSAEEFYVLLEYRCFIGNSWEIIREISCLAISKPAFEILITYASFQRRHRLAETLPDIVRPCKMATIRECVDCFKSGSLWQVLISALSCLLVSLYPIPERKRADFTPPVECLGFGYRRFPRVKPFIQKFLESGQRRPAKKPRSSYNARKPKRTLLRHRNNADQIVTDLTHRRVSETKIRNEVEDTHDSEKCVRCRRDNQNDLYTKILTLVKPPSATTYGSILVESPNGQDTNTVKRHDICLFVVGIPTFLEEEDALPLVIEDILQSDMIYHTIKHVSLKDPEGTRALVWNLPLPYRPPTDEQHSNIMSWCRELLGESIEEEDRGKFRKDNTDLWTHLQMLLHFLRLGSSYAEASLAATEFCLRFPLILKEKIEEWEKKGVTWFTEENEDVYRPVTLDDFWAWIDRRNDRDRFSPTPEPLFPPSKLYLKGDTTGRLALTNGKILEVVPGEED
jgi:hypothetical protein